MPRRDPPNKSGGQPCGAAVYLLQYKSARPKKLVARASLAQSVEHLSRKQKVASSNLVGGSMVKNHS